MMVKQIRFPERPAEQSWQRYRSSRQLKRKKSFQEMPFHVSLLVIKSIFSPMTYFFYLSA
jgi:hypothetical protein